MEVTPEAPANQEDKLSDSFLLYLKTRQQKLAEAKRDMSYPSPLSSKCQESGSRNLNDTTVIEPSNVSWDITDESFMAQEKICSDVSIPLIDLNGTSFSVSDSSDENNVIMKIVNNHAETPGNKFPINMTKLDMTLLGEIEEPSFMQQHQSLFQNSPIKQSPFGKNRPSTIAEEESINSGKNVSLDVSFQSLDPFTRPQSSGSDTFNTANDESISGEYY